ncbi:amidohydrolase family protein [Sphingomonas sp. Sphisp140]|uniref:amidohydrolase family protein n=1 Tax=unclassified Sphingomonas TaxID=196159 RepID=UPI0039AEEEEF
MRIGRREFIKLGGASAAYALAGGAIAAPTGRAIIDVHMHAYPATMQLPNPVTNPITGAVSPIRTGADHLAACIAEMKKRNVVKGVVSGGDGDRIQAAIDWHDRDPGRFVAGAGIRGSADTPLPPLDQLRKAFADGKLKVLGEVTSQYAGFSLSDPRYDPYLALAEEFGVPVALHTGTMPAGTSFDPCCTTARARLGNPELIEEALNRHPKLRLNIMHGGWPYLDDTIAMLMLYPNVNIDTGAVDWLLPRPAFHAWLRTLVESGFSKRIMFGSDHMYWPDAIGLAIDGIESADFLTEAQKQDILHDNAMRFYKLAPAR